MLFAEKLDADDPLKAYRNKFHLPRQKSGEPYVYLCGNSLGLQPKNVRAFIEQELLDWEKLGVEGHFHAKHPWMPYHEFLTDKMAGIVGAKPIEVVVMNTLSVNLHLMMVSFYRPAKNRRKIVMESDAFPSDRYAIESQIKFHGYDPAEDLLELKPREGGGIGTPRRHCQFARKRGGKYCPGTPGRRELLHRPGVRNETHHRTGPCPGLPHRL